VSGGQRGLSVPPPVVRFLDEILLTSGQYALFYILMYLADQRGAFFTDLGHASLLASLLLQTAVLVAWGHRPLVRFLGSLITPVIYAVFEVRGLASFFLDTGHLGFWLFSLLVGGLQALALMARHARSREALEFLSTFFSVVMFLVVYFYFDLRVTHEQLVAAGTLAAAVLEEHLRVSSLGPNLAEFLSDATHVYVVVGGALLAAALARGRVKVVRLTERITALFGTYVDGRVRDRIIGAGARGETKEVAILFSDIRGFTTVTERLDASAVVGMLNAYFSEWDRVSRAFNGIIDKFIGDAVMIIFEPRPGGDASRDAVDCALAMLEGLEPLRAELVRRGLPPLPGIGVGIASGPVILGAIGSESRRNYTAIGDTVNTASRLEGACKELHRTLVVSAPVAERLQPAVRARLASLGAVSLRGKAESLPVYGL
jgi:class 3 adenylate cyclase